jgi:hypothetical protein
MLSQKILIKFSIIILISMFLTSCQEDNSPYIPPEDPVLHALDSISLTLINAIRTDSIKSTVNWLQGMGTRFALANNRRDVAVKIRSRFINMGYTDTYLDSFWISVTWRYQKWSMWEYNVVATLRGSSHPDSINIIGAHYDDITTEGEPALSAPGANDNASGVAAMIEIARVMKIKKYSPGISIQFVAFAGEELDLLGSNDYAAKLALSGRPVKIMINNDMIGYEPTSGGMNWTVNICSYENAEQLWLDARTFANKYASLYSTNDITKRKNSDSYSFSTRGYKAVYLASKTPDPDNHTTEDIANYCNFNYLTRVASISCALLVYYN